MQPELPKIYWYLALTRIILVLIPQIGYIHPDEYFQSIEVQAGRVFAVEHNTPWEFNATFPVRSIAIPHFTIGLVYKLANIFEYFFKSYLTFSLITPYLIVVASRLLMCALSFVVDFTLYKIYVSNLAKHGLHPRFLHIIVNMPLLFNILAVFTFVGFCQATYSFVRGRHQLLPTVRSIKGLMMLSYIAPLGILSVFPHQEPRFLIPLIIPLVYLHSADILPDKDNILIKLEHTVPRKTKTTVKKDSNVYMKLWLVINIILVIFYGFLHQGGVYQVTNYLSKDMRTESLKTEYYIVTSHVYSLPESLFLQKSSNKLHHTKTSKYAVNKRYFLHEEGSSDLDILVSNIQKMSKRIEDYKHVHKNKRKYKLFLVIPSSLEDQLNSLMSKDAHFKKIKSFYPHISTEAFPNLAQDITYLYTNFKFDDMYTNILYSITKMMSSFGLNLYMIEKAP
ncbi:hypothetical protein Zmor_002664 [Zophobas morio]|uniref:Mannosyltransferase n=1 Tax=Zophobas morio TaxID=2755281 RepID=A0AA38HQF3_9CUCU|nr:hypothetical protein Zmor_002664 [Zophobas morio]